MTAIPYDLAGKRVWVAGHRGMVGAALVRRLGQEDCEVLTVDRAELDLMDQSAVRRWVAESRPDVVILAAAKVGGILANDTHPATFLYDNLVMETNVIEAAQRPASRNFFSSARPAFTRSWRTSRSRKRRS